VTTAQKLGSVIKSARDIMRKDKGLSGELDRLPQLTWIMFLKLLDDVEKVRQVEAELEEKEYKAPIKLPYRWRDWAGNDHFSGDTLLKFINDDKLPLASLPQALASEVSEELVNETGEISGLLAYLRSLQSDTGKDRKDVIARVFRDVTNRMTSGALLFDVLAKVNEIHFDNSEEVNILSLLYESMVKEMRDAAGDSGEFYTPRPVVKFMVEVMKPQLGEVIFDPACGTGGFLVEVYEYLQKQCSASDWEILQNSIIGAEAKPLPYLLVQMNLLLHGFEYPDIDYGNSLRFPLSELGIRDQVDVILTNPPFGGEEEDRIQNNFPPDRKTKETALLFLQLIMKRLRKIPSPPVNKGKIPSTPLNKGDLSVAGRAGVVFPNGVLFGDGMCAKIKEDLLSNFNLHTIIRLPNGVFTPYTSIPTNILFFDTSQPTEKIWFYELPLPEGRKNYTKTKPLEYEEFGDCLQWWDNRVENDFAWCYDFKAEKDKAFKLSQSHLDKAREAEEKVSLYSQEIKELEAKVKGLEASILDFTPQGEQKKIKANVKEIKGKIKDLSTQVDELKSVIKDEQEKANNILNAIYNLDRKNPNSGDDFEHLPPEKLIKDILKKDEKIASLMSEINAILEEEEK